MASEGMDKGNERLLISSCPNQRLIWPKRVTTVTLSLSPSEFTREKEETGAYTIALANSEDYY